MKRAQAWSLFNLLSAGSNCFAKIMVLNRMRDFCTFLYLSIYRSFSKLCKGHNEHYPKRSYLSHELSEYLPPDDILSENSQYRITLDNAHWNTWNTLENLNHSAQCIPTGNIDALPLFNNKGT